MLNAPANCSQSLATSVSVRTSGEISLVSETREQNQGPVTGAVKDSGPAQSMS